MTARISGKRMTFVAVATALVVACSPPGIDPGQGGLLTLGNWGGVDAAMIVSDTATHVHVGCTFGDISGRITLDPNGAFNVPGQYILRAYPVTVGPTLPARFAGRRTGDILTITVTVTDTVEHQTVVKGPVVVILGQAAQMGPCPICRRPILTTSAPLR